MRKASTLVIASIATLLGAYALIVALVVRPPVLGWLGFAIMATVVLLLAALAPIAFERTRVSALRPTRASDPRERLLVIADSHCDAHALCDAVVARAGGDVLVHVVVPVRVSHLHFLADDEIEERREARKAMLNSVVLLQQRGVATTGSIGTDKPLESMTDALGRFPATRVLLATPPLRESYWLERDVLAKARALTPLPVMRVVVPTTSASARASEIARSSRRPEWP